MKNYFVNVFKHFLSLAALTAFASAIPASDVIAASADVSVNSVDRVTAELSSEELPKGWLLWHSYSEYTALDSKLYLQSPDGSKQEISGDFVHAMNGYFGITPEQITFMAIDSSTQEWDIYLYDNGNITNLTKNSGFRNEDPKWSPDGKQIVFKRGYWDNSINDFVYDLALLDIATSEVTMLTDDRPEDAMPFFSEDGKYLYYTRYVDKIGSIYRMDMTTHATEDIYSETNVTAYYPIVKGEQVYFAKWYSAENHSDQMMCYDGTNISVLPFNSEQYDCSDPCPITDETMVYSGTADGEYDLYYYNGSESVRLTEISSDQNDLGADFYSWEEYEEYLNNSKVIGDVNCDGKFNIADVVLLQKWILALPDANLSDWKAGDLCEDDRLDVFDLCMMKKELIRNGTKGKTIYVGTTEELREALKNAEAGDTILLSGGEYEWEQKGTAGSLFMSSAEGTENAPITIKSADKSDPAVIKGKEFSDGIAFYITGDYWDIEDIIFCDARKGIILDNSNHTIIKNVTVYNTGEEGIHIRDGSSECRVIGANVHDCGLLTPKYGEGIYIGSAKSTSGYSHDCNDNILQNCIIGPNTAAECVDIKEYTKGNIIENCTMYGGGMTATDSFIDVKGNETIVRGNIFYDDENANITDAVQVHCQVDDWGLDNEIYNNTAYLTAETAYFLRSWSGTSCSVWNNMRNPESDTYMYRAYSGSTMTIIDETLATT